MDALSGMLFPDARLIGITEARGDVWLKIELKVMARNRRDVKLHEVIVRMTPSEAFATAGQLQSVSCQALEEAIAGKADE